MRNKHLLKMLVIGILSIGFSISQASSLSYPEKVINVLDSADSNRGELEKVLSHYSSPEDSLKLKAAFYLIANMKGHSFVTYKLCDTTGKKIDFNVLDYLDYKTMKAASDSLEKEYGTLDFKRDTIIYDINAITSNFLINQIDYAFQAWRTKPWAKKLTFKQFCDYVLPYRGSNEPLEPWRKEFLNKYQNLKTKMADTSNPIEAASLINDDVKSWFTFNPRFYYHPTDQGLPEMMKNKMGRCEDMTNLAIYAMRANGLAVTSDYTPYWANHGNNHAWNALVTPDGKVIPFMGAESNPGEYHLPYIMAKVYRKTYNEQKQNLIFQKRKQKKVPGWLAGKSYIDVTSAYTKVCDVTVKFDQEIPDSVDIAYLCVFNSGEWKAINWGRIKNGTAVFKDMGVNIAYLPALYLNKKIVPYAPPLILKNDCQIVKLPPRQKQLESVSLISTNPHGQPKVADSTIKTYLKPEQKYELFFWKGGWQSLGERVAQKNKPLVFENVPSDGLYWLVADGSDKEERIFTYEKSKQIWW